MNPTSLELNFQAKIETLKIQSRSSEKKIINPFLTFFPDRPEISAFSYLFFLLQKIASAATDRIAIKKHLELPFIKKGLSPSFPPLKIPPQGKERRQANDAVLLLHQQCKVSVGQRNGVFRGGRKAWMQPRWGLTQQHNKNRSEILKKVDISYSFSSRYVLTKLEKYQDQILTF